MEHEECEMFFFDNKEIVNAVRNFDERNQILWDKSILCHIFREIAESYLLDENGDLRKDILDFETDMKEDLEKYEGYSKLNGAIISLLKSNYSNNTLDKDDFEQILNAIGKELNVLPKGLQKFILDLKNVFIKQFEKEDSILNADLGGVTPIYVMGVRGMFFCSEEFRTVQTTEIVDIIERKKWIRNAVNIATTMALLELGKTHYNKIKVIVTTLPIGKISKHLKLPFISSNTQVAQGSKNHARVIIDCLIQVLMAHGLSGPKNRLVNILKVLLGVLPVPDLVIGFGIDFILCVGNDMGVIVFEKIKRFLHSIGII